MYTVEQTYRWFASKFDYTTPMWYVAYNGEQVTEAYHTKELAQVACDHYNSGKYVVSHS